MAVKSQAWAKPKPELGTLGMQRSEDLGYDLLLSQAISKEVHQKWSIYVGC